VLRLKEEQRYTSTLPLGLRSWFWEKFTFSIGRCRFCNRQILLLTAQSRVPPDKIKAPSLTDKLPALYVTRESLMHSKESVTSP